MSTPSSIAQESIDLHRRLHGKIRIEATTPIDSLADLTRVYTPGVGAVSSRIAEDPTEADALTWRKNTVAVISDGSAVLGLGNIGPAAALPVMEGKSAIFKRFADINAIPLVLGTQDVEELITTISALEPSFGAIQLEDISAPRCFEIEARLQKRLSIPVMHDDQHGTAIVILAGLLNALKVVGKRIEDVRVVLNGAGAAGVATAKLLKVAGVRSFAACDRTGVIYQGREGLNQEKHWLAEMSTDVIPGQVLADVVKGADVLIGVSSAGAFSKELVQTMAPKAIIFAIANPIPEILPDVAREAGVVVVGTGRSDFPNQVNNALCYPGLFRGMLDHGVKQVTDEIKVRAAHAIANFIKNPTPDNIIPTMFEEGLHEAVAKSVV
ncbi:NADP-dependent malic enzyme [Patescibacteria group bacterium]|nr:NADP-dependent malic enzyme [Patescibacteria group bacterium]MBP9710636.1 NADP-dependent malic enzyme [Patescibacteria group bacterium]